MRALAPAQSLPRITPETARQLVELATQIGYESAITVHVWVNALDKEVANETDALATIQNLKSKLEEK